MTEPAPDASSPPTSSYAMTHCVTCAAGWTRRSAEGGVKVVCLLDRELVWPAMASCDRYEPRDPV